MLQSALLVPLNHLLTGAAWARQRLQPFAGQVVALRYGELGWRLRVTEEGSFAAESADSATVRIDLPNNTPLLLLTDRSAIFAQAQLQGPAEFCEALALVFRNLRWDAEADLARIVGDIPARRLHQLAASGLRWQAEAGRRLAANSREYLAEEQTTLLSRPRLDRHRTSLADLQKALDTLENRIDRIRPGV